MDLTKFEKDIHSMINSRFKRVIEITDNYPILNIEVKSDSITLKQMGEGKEKNKTLRTYTLVGEVKDNCLYLHPLIDTFVSFTGAYYSQMLFVLLLDAFIFYSSKEKLPFIVASENDFVQTELLLKGGKWEEKQLKTLQAVGFEPIDKAHAKFPVEKNDLPKNSYILEVKNAIDCFDIAVDIDVFMDKRKGQKPAEQVYHYTYISGVPCNINIAITPDSKTTINLIFNENEWKWKVDDEVIQAHAPFTQEVEEFIEKIYEKNKLSYLVNLPTNELYKLLSSTINEEHLMNFVLEAKKHGVTWMDFENESMRHNQIKLGWWDKPTLEVKQLHETAWILKLNGVYMFLLVESDQLTTKFTRDKEEMEHYLSAYDYSEVTSFLN